MTTFKLGIDKKTGETVSIQDAAKGLSCDCICADCKKQFVAAQGQKNEWHFRHYEETDCKGGQETALHKLAKKIIADNSKITLPFYGVVSYDNSVQEKYFQTIQPDVTATTSGQNFFFEVLVTHPVDQVKENFYKNGEHKSVEIDLKHFNFTTENLENEVLRNIENKRLIFWEKKVVAQTNNDNSVLYFVLFLLGLLTFGLIKSSNRRSRR